jgi:undecaprenyl pyrophosphate phosphatase UppP
MSGIIALVIAVIVGAIFLSFVAHLLFSPWLLLVAVGVFAWIKLRPRVSRR